MIYLELPNLGTSSRYHRQSGNIINLESWFSIDIRTDIGGEIVVKLDPACVDSVGEGRGVRRVAGAGGPLRSLRASIMVDLKGLYSVLGGPFCGEYARRVDFMLS